MMINLVFIGAGNLTRMFVQGWQEQSEALDMHIAVLARSTSYQLNHWGDDLVVPTMDPEVLAMADVIVLGIKPKDVTVALHSIQQYAPPTSLVISLVAGIPVSAIAAELTQAVVRTMPNIAVATGQGTIVVAQSSGLGHPVWPTVESALKAIAHVVVVDEPLIDAATALSGSGPAYIYLVMQALIDAATAMGISPDLGRELCAHTIQGAAAVALAYPDHSLAQLTRWVASPGGTTEAALQSLRASDIHATFRRALFDARAKASDIDQARPPTS